MKAPEIKDLINFIASSGLQEVNVETAEIKLHIKRNMDGQSQSSPVAVATPSVAPVQVAVPATAPAAVETAAPEVATPAPAPAAEASSANLVEIKSPMIGTFYASPNPESPSFLNVGDTVKKGDVVCIVEAMKLFNEIESEVTGKVVKILVDDSTPVEYDQPLFLVDPS